MASPLQKGLGFRTSGFRVSGLGLRAYWKSPGLFRGLGRLRVSGLWGCCGRFRAWNIEVGREVSRSAMRAMNLPPPPPAPLPAVARPPAAVSKQGDFKGETKHRVQRPCSIHAETMIQDLCGTLQGQIEKFTTDFRSVMQEKHEAELKVPQAQHELVLSNFEDANHAYMLYNNEQGSGSVANLLGLP